MPPTPRSAVQEPPARAVGLTDTEIVDVARSMVAADGVDGLTMRRLSTALGVALGATYHHVRTKHELLILIGKDLFAEIAAARPATSLGWDEQLRAWMLVSVDVLGGYPGMAQFLLAHTDEVPPLALNEGVTEILRGAGLAEDDANAVMSALFFYVGGMTTSIVPATSTGTVSMRDMSFDVRELFLEGLELILDGARGSPLALEAPGVGGAKPMSTDDPVHLTVRRLFDLTIAGDVAASLECFAPDARYFVNAWHEPVVGREAINIELERQRTLFVDFTYDVLSVTSSGPRVVVERLDAVVMGGVDVRMHTVGVFELDDDGLIAVWRDYLDMSEIASQLPDTP